MQNENLRKLSSRSARLALTLVYQRPAQQPPHTTRCRRGTVIATTEQLIEVLGEPYRYYEDADDRAAGVISMVWSFDTPRGLVELGTFWSNAPNEWSVRAMKHWPNKQDVGRKAMGWFRRFLQAKGFVPSDLPRGYGVTDLFSKEQL